MIRTILLAFASFLSGCLLGNDPCEKARADSCFSLKSATLVETALVPGPSTTTWYATFAPVHEESTTLRLSCITDDELDSCVRSFTMPDLDRLPHGEALMLTDNSSTESIRGSFRIDDVVRLSDQESYRFTGSIDELHFEPPGETVVFAGGEFDVASSPVGE